MKKFWCREYPEYGYVEADSVEEARYAMTMKAKPKELYQWMRKARWEE